ncbi:hypothetical protein E2C01_005214 [Portunus trituberculatus]|uniref:Uncharacterized protein n=1 Tax=Portunus trituberculatus TaxID=210409 RepID=A0A5B7CTE9_PORTR|nr:hypothetical protein [Portunus trituberculatus]
METPVAKPCSVWLSAAASVCGSSGHGLKVSQDLSLVACVLVFKNKLTSCLIHELQSRDDSDEAPACRPYR